MTTLLTLYIAGMPVAFLFLVWAFWGDPRGDLFDMGVMPVVFVFAFIVVFWPVFAVLFAIDTWRDN